MQQSTSAFDEFDDFMVVSYDHTDLHAGDIVYIRSSGGAHYWGEVRDDFVSTDHSLTVRPWGSNDVHVVRPESILFAQVHRCECGTVVPYSQRICHPDA